MSVNVIIPNKSNVEDFNNLVKCLHEDPAVDEIVVVADGDEAHNRISSTVPVPVTLLRVKKSIGLHTMWNLGMNHLRGSNKHLAIINDDVSISNDTVSKLVEVLDSNPDIGLLTPASDHSVIDYFIPSTSFAGYFMLLSKDLVDEWRFDENMKWWYGDVDVILWVNKTKGRQTGITGVSHATNNRSYTITNDPPPNFHRDIENDAVIFHSKWG